MNHEIRLYLDRFDAKSEPVTLHDTIARALYVVEGSLALHGLSGAGTAATLGANSAVSAETTRAVSGGSLPAQVLRWEIMPDDASSEIEGAADSRLLLSAAIALEPSQDYLLRCDRVDFPPAAQALRHTHQGAGIRCLLHGSIRIETEGTNHRYGPMDAWFENGSDAVHAFADLESPTAFARVMLLPRSLLGGKSSIQYVSTEDLDKPKSQRYQIFVDHPVELPR